MSVLNLLACALGRRDEVPNQELARQLVETQDQAGIRELIDNLDNKNSEISADCIKVLYEIGYLKPALIAGGTEAFLKLLNSRNNRMVWGGMIALSTVAALSSELIFNNYAILKASMVNGSVITVDNAVKTAALVASCRLEYARVITGDLLAHLQTCRARDVPQHAEHSLPAVNSENKQAILKVLQGRTSELSETQMKRVKRVINLIEKI
ncbi:MAG: hypothetical protein LWX83_17545 [Anaerolineae bacterium]|nr:hypothetical protein [Anaerolineae bacterium]